MVKPRIDWVDPLFPAYLLSCMVLAAYGGGVVEAMFLLAIAWGDRYITGEKEKALPRKSYLIDPIPRLFIQVRVQK